MNDIDCLATLRRANPRQQRQFVEEMHRVTERVVLQLPTQVDDGAAPTSAALHRNRVHRSRRVVRVVAPTAAAATIATVALLTFGSPFGESTLPPAAAMQQAAVRSAQAADASGTVVVRITENGSSWATKTVAWNGNDLSVVDATTTRQGQRELRVVDGNLYMPSPETPGLWIELGSPANVDPGSGTTPDEYLAAVREDAGGATVRRITASMTDLRTNRLPDGSTVYRGFVRAGDLARETTTKEGMQIRVLPYGYVAHDDAANPASPIAISITVGANGAIREIAATWGGASTWSYRLEYRNLGSTISPAVPQNVRTIGQCREVDATNRPAC